ncbi:MAG: c-type cytochrome biogenesis protein CcmI [Gemmatimonadota bacterium]|nr:c-type cytochrome biogenesis protein CcmI [Gemmatimonadota bacterium]
MTAILGGVLLAAGVVLFILEPVFSGQRAPLYDGDDVYDDAAAQRRIALTALRDLEYDRATGKVDGEDYERLKAELSREALKHLEARTVQSSEAADPAGAPAGGEGSPDLGVELGLEAEIARIRAALREGMACEACDTVNRVGSSFCSHCGAPLKDREAAGAQR